MTEKRAESLKTLAERGATEGEREAARQALHKHTSKTPAQPSAKDRLIEISDLCREAERLICASLQGRLATFASPARDKYEQSDSLARIARATEELQKLHALGRRCGGCAVELPDDASWKTHALVVRIVGSGSEHFYLKGLIAGLRGESLARGQSPSSRYEHGVALGQYLYPPAQ